jgi:hypothetical protein
VRVLHASDDIDAPRSALASTDREIEPDGGHIMLETLAIVLAALWLLGLVSSYTMGGFIHVLLVLAVVVVVIRVIQGRPILN